MNTWAQVGSACILSLCALAPALPPVDDCGLVLTPDLAVQARHQQAAGLYELHPLPEQTYTIPIAVHIVRKTNGTGGLPLTQLATAMADANQHYAPIGMQFCQTGEIDYINSDFYHSQMTTNSHFNALRQMNVVPGAINIYFVGSVGFCGLSSFTFSSVQGIIMNNACTGLPDNHSTYAHEIGHYFDLFHTHETGMGGPECTNGSNCATAGDLVCDTKADPNVLGAVNGACVWTGSATPPCGSIPYDPPVKNLMSYSTKTCRDHFTPQQYTRALATLINLRTELDLSLCDSACYIDCDGDGAASIDDFICFQTNFSLGDPYADCDGDVALSIDDFICFQTAFALGC